MKKSKKVMVLGVDGFDPKILESMMGAAHKARPQERIQMAIDLAQITMLNGIEGIA